jgi:hypothetical protein
MRDGPVNLAEFNVRRLFDPVKFEDMRSKFTGFVQWLFRPKKASTPGPIRAI